MSNKCQVIRPMLSQFRFFSQTKCLDKLSQHNVPRQVAFYFISNLTGYLTHAEETKNTEGMITLSFNHKHKRELPSQACRI